jgi:DNA-binding NtrC family response regulator
MTEEGFDVTVCDNGLTALALVECSERRIDVVVSDVGLPGLRGDKLAAKLRQVRPALPVVLMTGYSDVVAPGKEALLGVAAVLQKPVTIEDLLAAVRDALQGGVARARRAQAAVVTECPLPRTRVNDPAPGRAVSDAPE